MITDIIIGLVALALGIALGRRKPRSPVAPPATVRQLERAARANRADIRPALKTRTAASAQPPSDLPPPIDHFDHLETQDL